MSTAVQPQRSGDGIDKPASPDYLKGQQKNTQGIHKREVGGENFVELKYRSLNNLAAAKFAKGLGVFSIALGLAEILAPHQVGEMAGLSSRYRKYLPILGAREIAHGLGIFSSAKPSGAVWSRVAGDVVDLAFLGAAFTSRDTNKTRLAGATVAIIGAGVADLVCAQKLSSSRWSENDGNPNAPSTVGQSSGRRAMIA